MWELVKSGICLLQLLAQFKLEFYINPSRGNTEYGNGLRIFVLIGNIIQTSNFWLLGNCLCKGRTQLSCAQNLVIPFYYRHGFDHCSIVSNTAMLFVPRSCWLAGVRGCDAFSG